MYRLRFILPAALAVLLAAGAYAVTAKADPVLAAAGDIACAPGSTSDPDDCQQSGTATEIQAAAPSVVAALGDQQYESGLLSEYQGSYDLSWGAFKSLTRPVPGNHDYKASATAHGYFSYFGSLAGSSTGYYSYDLGSWHVIALNSNCADSGCAYHPAGGVVSSAEVDWLKADLAAHQGQCTLAYWHHPLFSQSPVGPSPDVKPLWDALYAHGADVALNGHSHVYERYGQLDPTGSAATTHGIREFTSALGGDATIPWASPPPSPTPEARDNTHFGVLFMTLHQGSYDWEYKGADGTVYDSSGPGDQTKCHEPEVTVDAPQSTFAGDANAFHAAVTVPDGTPIAGWSWDFGDGATSSEQNPPHTYASPGDKTVTLVVTDQRGLTTSVTRTVGVGARPDAGSPGSSSTSPPAGTPPQGFRPAVAPRLRLAVSRRHLSVVLRHGLIVRSAGSFAGGLLIQVRLVHAVRAGRTSSLASKVLTLGLRPHSTRIRLGRSARNRLAGARGVVLAIEGVLTDRAGHRAAANATLHLHG